MSETPTIGGMPHTAKPRDLWTAHTMQIPVTHGVDIRGTKVKIVNMLAPVLCCDIDGKAVILETALEHEPFPKFKADGKTKEPRFGKEKILKYAEIPDGLFTDQEKAAEAKAAAEQAAAEAAKPKGKTKAA